MRGHARARRRLQGAATALPGTGLQRPHRTAGTAPLRPPGRPPRFPQRRAERCRLDAPRRPPSGRSRWVGACRAPPAPGLEAGPGRAGPRALSPAGAAPARWDPAGPVGRLGGGGGRGASPASLGGRSRRAELWERGGGAPSPSFRPPPFILLPSPRWEPGRPCLGFPLTPSRRGAGEGRGPGVGGTEPPRPPPPPHCPPRFARPPLPAVLSRCRGAAMLLGGGVAARPLPAALSFALCGTGGHVRPSLHVSPSLPAQPLLIPGAQPGCGSPALLLERAAFGAELAVCVRARFSSCGAAHTCVQECTPSCTQLSAQSCSAAVRRGGPLLCPVEELWGGCALGTLHPSPLSGPIPRCHPQELNPSPPSRGVGVPVVSLLSPPRAGGLRRHPTPPAPVSFEPPPLPHGAP